jgi:hypothetical protein
MKCREAGLDPRYKKPEPRVEKDGLEAMGPLTVDNLAGSKYKKDTSEANGSSIAILVEYCGKKVLLAGDARAPNYFLTFFLSSETKFSSLTIILFLTSFHTAGQFLYSIPTISWMTRSISFLFSFVISIPALAKTSLRCLK